MSLGGFCLKSDSDFIFRVYHFTIGLKMAVWHRKGYTDFVCQKNNLRNCETPPHYAGENLQPGN